jgi:hypothetical protein
MKGSFTRLTFLAFSLALFAVKVNAEPWRGIVPLKSTRSDVERLLGKPLPGNMSFYVTYKLEAEEVRVQYADKKLCTRTDECDCRVPDDTVLHIVVRPKGRIRFSSLTLDQTKFHPIVNPENSNNVAYSNSNAGIMCVISKSDDLVLYVQYGPTAKDCKDALKAPSIAGLTTEQPVDRGARYSVGRVMLFAAQVECGSPRVLNRIVRLSWPWGKLSDLTHLHALKGVACYEQRFSPCC